MGDLGSLGGLSELLGDMFLGVFGDPLIAGLFALGIIGFIIFTMRIGFEGSILIGFIAVLLFATYGLLPIWLSYLFYAFAFGLIALAIIWFFFRQK